MRVAMENFSTGGNKQHKVTMNNRKACMLTGVKDVLSFDVKEVLLETEQGLLSIKGEDLHVSRLSLDSGEIDLDGRIDSFAYSDATGMGHKGESLFAKLFR